MSHRTVDVTDLGHRELEIRDRVVTKCLKGRFRIQPVDGVCAEWYGSLRRASTPKFIHV